VGSPWLEIRDPRVLVGGSLCALCHTSLTLFTSGGAKNVLKNLRLHNYNKLTVTYKILLIHTHGSKGCFQT
jgi:hypothetical protein